METAVKKPRLLFISWQHLHILTQQCETTCRLELARYCTKYAVDRLTVYHLCKEYHLTLEQLYFHLNM